MGDFSLGWLALREAVDTRARSAHLVQRLADWLSQRVQPASGPAAPLTALDLGCGDGANLRYLAPRLSTYLNVPQRWICLDRDRGLLAALPRRTAEWAGGLGLPTPTRGDGLRIQGPGAPWEIATRTVDLASGAAALDIDRGTLVVASALLDLVSEAWLAGLIGTCYAAGAPLLLALTYDGRVVIEPGHPLDQRVIGLVNAHQRRDKGLGPALGPGAPVRLAQLSEAMGFAVELADSDWLLDPNETGIQLALTAGWAAAALEQAGERTGPEGKGLKASIAQWREFRVAAINARCSRTWVGHQDALLLPK
ncbi:MAG TPA: class I SAM-dependent methyltransferase [Lamprocystis sp. (in: g-proteobacteria)]|nr:class I SAM-dependent methyltransferase [Lamprocystis sp. (in: g-proteobacteria)]